MKYRPSAFEMTLEKTDRMEVQRAVSTGETEGARRATGVSPVLGAVGACVRGCVCALIEQFRYGEAFSEEVIMAKKTPCGNGVGRWLGQYEPARVCVRRQGSFA